jgi:hypothetical protein
VWAAIDAAPAIKTAPNSCRMERDKGGAFRRMGYPHLLDRTGKTFDRLVGVAAQKVRTSASEPAGRAHLEVLRMSDSRMA